MADKVQSVQTFGRKVNNLSEIKSEIEMLINLIYQNRKPPPLLLSLRLVLV